MTTTTISLKLQGSYCNHWPLLQVIVNDQVLFDGLVENTVDLEFECNNLNNNNYLKLLHYDKAFGDNNVFDTDLDSKSDCSIRLLDIQFDNISISSNKLSQLEFITDWTPKQLTDTDSEFIKQHNKFESNGYMNFNGFINLPFETPILSWLTVFKYKTDNQSTASYFSGHDQRWHYEQDQNLISEIKGLMNFD